MLKVQKRGGFSDRNGINSLNTEMQYKSLDVRTRNLIENCIKRMYLEYRYSTWYDEEIQAFAINILEEVYAKVISLYGVKENYFWGIISETIASGEYDEVLTLFEYVLQYFDDDEFNDIANELFKSEYVGYRFIQNKFIPITDENEISSIDEAVSNEYLSVSEHIGKAIALLSDRSNPDYENSIKESISAVETMCDIIVGGKCELGQALKKLEESGVVIHSALKTGFIKIYGYTSDAKGIRHAGDIGGPSSTFDEAKFMLVSCSAFINYLKGVSAK